MSRSRRRLLIVGVLVAAVAVAATAATLLLTSRGGQGTRYLTSTARTGSLATSVEADFTLGAAHDSTTISLGSSSSSSATTVSSSSSSAGVVTDVALAAGAKPRTLQRLLTISGKPVYAFVSSAPLYTTLSTSLSSGAQKTNVEALQRALKAAGCFSGTINGEFGSSTKTALEDWQADHGLSETGEVTTSRFVWVPSGAVIESWNVIVGGGAGSGTTLATVDFPRPLVATAAVSQADIAKLKVGQKATLTISDSSTSLTGTITTIAGEPTSSSSSGSSASSASSSSTIAEYEVTFSLAKVPTSVKSGMTGSLTVTIARRSDVLVVPTSAVQGTATASSVRVLKNGKLSARAVTTGMATSSLTEITSGLTAGETVVTGTYTPSATASSTSASNSRSLLNSLSGGGAAGPPGQ